MEWVFSELNPNDAMEFYEINKWQVKFLDVTEGDPQDFKDLVGQDQIVNFDMAYGLTNVNSKIVNVYIKNINNDFQFLSNFYVAAHELDHMLLAIYYPGKTAARRWPDKAVPAGTVGNFYVTEVHDRDYETNNNLRPDRKVTIYRPWYSRFFLGNIYLFGIDITDLCDTRKIDRD